MVKLVGIVDQIERLTEASIFYDRGIFGLDSGNSLSSLLADVGPRTPGGRAGGPTVRYRHG